MLLERILNVLEKESGGATNQPIYICIQVKQCICIQVKQNIHYKHLYVEPQVKCITAEALRYGSHSFYPANTPYPPLTS